MIVRCEERIMAALENRFFLSAVGSSGQTAAHCEDFRKVERVGSLHEFLGALRTGTGCRTGEGVAAGRRSGQGRGARVRS